MARKCNRKGAGPDLTSPAAGFITKKIVDIADACDVNFRSVIAVQASELKEVMHNNSL